MAEVIYWYAKVGVMSEIVIVEKMGPIKWHFHALGKIYDWQTTINKKHCSQKNRVCRQQRQIRRLKCCGQFKNGRRILIFVAQKGNAAGCWGYGPRNTCISGKINRRPMGLWATKYKTEAQFS